MKLPLVADWCGGQHGLSALISGLGDRFFASQSGSMHHAPAVRIVGDDAVHHTRVVPDHKVARCPSMTIDELWLRRPFAQAAEQSAAILIAHVFDVSRG